MVITARRLEELSAIAEKTKRKYDVQIMCVATDLATPEVRGASHQRPRSI